MKKFFLLFATLGILLSIVQPIPVYALDGEETQSPSYNVTSVSEDGFSGFVESDWTIDFTDPNVAKLLTYTPSSDELYIPGQYTFSGETQPRKIEMDSWHIFNNAQTLSQIKRVKFEEINGVKVLIKSSNWSEANSPFAGFSLTSANGTVKYADLTGLETGHVTTLNGFFRKSTELTYLDINGWDTSNVVDMIGAFTFLTSLETLDIKSLDTSSAEHMAWMFNHLPNVKYIDLSNLDTSKLRYGGPVSHPHIHPLAYMFGNTPQWKVIDLRSMVDDIDRLGSPTEMFYYYENGPHQKLIIGDSPLLKDYDYAHDHIIKTNVSTFDANGGTFSDGSSESRETFPSIWMSTEAEAVNYYNTKIMDMKDNVPTRTNYRFAGWDKEIEEVSNLEELAYAVDDKISAVWEPLQEIRWNYNNPAFPMVTEHLVNNASLVAPEVSHDGKRIEGWYTDNGSFSNQIPTTVPDDSAGTIHNYYAKWETETYTVSFNSNGGSTVSDITDVAHEANITEPTKPTKAGFVFDAWYKDATLNTKWNFTTDKVTDDITLYAGWTPATYTVSFNSNGGSTVSDITDVAHEANITEPTKPTKAGFVFDAWYKDATLNTKWNFTTDKVTDDITLYAGWTPATYTVSFNSNGGSTVSDITDVAHNANINEPTKPTRVGFVFDAWYKDATLNTKWNFTTDKVTSDTTLYAGWIPATYTVSFNSNGGSPVSDITDVAHNANINEPSKPTKAGFVFDAWYKDATLNTKWNFTTDKVTDDITLYAGWTPATYTVSFNSNGGSTVSDITDVAHNANINEPTKPTRVGFVFDAWYKDATLNTKWDFTTDKVTSDTTLYAGWIPATYTVSFNSNGGSPVSDITDVAHNANINEPSKPTKAGFVFDAWYKDATLNTKWDFTTDKVTDDITLYAGWTPATYTVSFNSNGGSTVSDITDVAHNGIINEPTKPTKVGFVFDAWYKDATLNTKWDFTTDKVTDDITLYAGWTPATYTVSFNSNGGSPVSDITDVAHEANITEPSKPTKAGFVFDSWYKDATLNTKWDFTTEKVTDDITLYAGWTPATYTVSFNSNGGSPVSDITDVAHEANITEPTKPTKAGFVFDAWYKDATLNTKWDFTTDKVTDDITLYAGWTPATYTVSFNSNGGSPVSDITDVAHEANITEPSKPTKAGFVFDSWYKDATLNTKWDFTTDKVTDDITLYAGWTPATYTVSFNSNGGSPVSDITDVAHEANITEPSKPTKAGFVFDAWYKDATLNTKWDFTTDKVTDDITLYAGWTPATYTVSFNSNGGSPVSDITDVAHNAIINEPTKPTKSGFVFDAWYKDATLSKKWDFITDKVTDDITLYAGWTPATYTVSFNSNGGSTVSDITDVAHDANITEPTKPTRVGFVFDAWYKDATLNTKWNFTTDKVTDDITLYAGWTPATYTVSFNSNGGSPVSDITDVAHNANINEPSKPTKAGFVFDAWYKDATLNTKWDFTTDKVTSDTTLYAGWIPATYTVSFNSNGGSPVSDITDVAHNAKINEPTKPTKAGFVFDGWYKESTLKNQWNFEVDTVEDNMTLYAAWKKQPDEKQDETLPSTGISDGSLYFGFKLIILGFSLIVVNKKRME